MMKLVSVNVGLPRLALWNGAPVSTGIFKEPVAGRVRVRTLNLDGDRQSDLSVHGGISKAVYVYPVEHYDYWREELPGVELPFGMFGENFTTEGLLETCVQIGDRFRVGTMEVTVTEPRLPCYKLGIKFGRSDIIKRFLASNRTGFYLAVAQEGEVEAGDEIKLIGREANGVTVSDIVRLYVHDKHDVTTLGRAVEVAALPQSWRNHFQQQLENLIK